MKNNWFWGVLIVIILSWIGNIIYFEVHQLDEPVVLDAYIDIQSTKHTTFSLFYLTNSSEVVELETLIAAGYTYDNDQNFFPWFGDISAQSYRQQFTHQFLKQASFTFDERSLEQVIKGFQAEDLYARFTNGQVVPVQLEKLNFQTPASETNFLSSKVDFGSSQGVQGSVLEATEDVRMDAIVLPESLLNQVDLKVQISDSSSASANVEKIMSKNWEEIDAPLYTDVEWPIHLKKGDSVELIFQVQYSNIYIDFVHDWTGKTDTGKTFTYSLPLQIEPILASQDVKGIVQKARGEHR